jgi:hypothetical protein
MSAMAMVQPAANKLRPDKGIVVIIRYRQRIAWQGKTSIAEED